MNVLLIGRRLFVRRRVVVRRGNGVEPGRNRAVYLPLEIFKFAIRQRNIIRQIFSVTVYITHDRLDHLVRFERQAVADGLNARSI